MYNKCKSNSYIYTKNVQVAQNLHKVQTKNSLKLEINVFCTYKKCTNYKKPIKLANLNNLCVFLCIHKMSKLYKIYASVSRIKYVAANIYFLYTQKPYIL